MVRRCHTLRPAGNLDRVGIHYADPLQELPKPQLKAVVKAPQDGRVTMILFARSVEVKNLLHQILLDERVLVPSYPRKCAPPGRLPALPFPTRHDKITRTQLLR